MKKLRRLIEDAEDVITSYAATQNRELFHKVSTEMLEEMQKKCNVAFMNVCAQNIVIGLFPHISLTKHGRQYFTQFNVDSDHMTAFSSCDEFFAKQFFCVNEEMTPFIQLLKNTDEKMAVYIFYAVGKISCDLATNADIQAFICADKNVAGACISSCCT